MRRLDLCFFFICCSAIIIILILLFSIFLMKSGGSYLTPAHHYGDFRFKTYAPMAFRYFREMFGIRPDDYMVRLVPSIAEQKLCQNGKEVRQRKLSKWKERSDDGAIAACWLSCFSCWNLCPQYSLCNEGLIELSNSGASGSLFYLSSDDEFIIKTVQHKEAEFLQKLLPGYFMVRLDGTFPDTSNLVLCPA